MAKSTVYVHPKPPSTRRMWSLIIILTAVLLSSSAATAADQVNLLYYYYYRCRGDGGRYADNSACLSNGNLKAQQARASSFASGGVVGAESLRQRAFDNASIVCPYYDDHPMLGFSGGDIHRNLTNRPAPWVAWNMDFVTGAAGTGRSYGRKVRKLSNLIGSVAADTPDFMAMGCRSSCLTDDDDMFSPVPKCWFSNQSEDGRVGGKILVLTSYKANDGPHQIDMPNGKILSTVNIRLLITFAGFVPFVSCLILTGGIIQGIRDGRLQRKLGDWRTQVTGNIDPGFSLYHFVPAIIRDTIGNFSKEGRGSFRLVYRPLVLVIVMALLVSSTAGASVGCYNRENMTRRVKPLYYDCGCPNISPTMQEQDSYYDNRTSLAGKLVRALRASPRSIFTNYTMGSVSGFVLCRGDYSGSVCAGNLQQTINDYINVTDINTNQIICESSTDITIYYDQHMLSFFAGDGYTYKDPGSNRPAWVASNMNYVMRSTGAAGLYGERVRELLSDTASYAALNSSGLYATGKSWFDEAGVGIIYGLVQCRPDMRRDLCQQCLDNLTAEVPRQFTTVSGDHCVGGRILGVWCNVRFEKELFFKETSETRQLHKPKGRLSKVNIALITVAGFVVFVLCISRIVWIIQRIRDRRLLRELGDWHNEVTREIDSRFSLYPLSVIRDATRNFSEENRLGRGSFGPVYRGILPDGLEVAVKRLDASSWQGSGEFLNEIKLILRLQHANLVRLLGCCLQRCEMMLVYEYMSNRSLDYVFSDPLSRDSLNWPNRLRVIDGIAQGLVYLHSFSEPQRFIIHRDMKLSNILLDSEMNPKISDFGIARIYNLGVIEPEATDVVGTRGYMAPEYIRKQILSVKYDVFSFGVLLLEIISGRRVNVAVFTEYGRSDHLLTHAWHIWRGGRYTELVDPSLRGAYQMVELRRRIQIALLCVQENPEHRPHMRAVTTMLSNNDVSLPDPYPPAYFNGPLGDAGASASSNNRTGTVFYTSRPHVREVTTTLSNNDVNNRTDGTVFYTRPLGDAEASASASSSNINGTVFYTVTA